MTHDNETSLVWKQTNAYQNGINVEELENKQMKPSNRQIEIDRSFVRLSLLTMTNPKQMHEVLLFVCSKMANKTNLSPQPTIADRKRDV